ncbi:hypothetical protein H6A07_03930 [Olsenella uli]|uniref:energy-coupling factor transporter transmembrane component T family protein n=1 Tax=Olsenella uli TaxID=133926 RepID=UPI001957D1E4|nr:energy-coupling factor transporter transmembrane component T [Olsenella uli]MBM6675894.1 hypothetical protein [Olsenella uli]
MAAPRARAFDAVHAAVPTALFAGVVALTMLAVQPALVAASLAGALLFSLLARGVAATARGLVWQLPLLALVCLANPFFSASGSTLLIKLGPRSVYLESLAYGATMGALMVAVVLWLEGAAAALTQDRLLALAPRRARALPLLLGMVSQLVPQLLRRSRDVRAGLAACTAAGARPAARDALVRTSSLLLTWSLEESLERADSMRARGWESGRSRTCYRPECLRRRDVVILCGIGALLVLAAVCAWRFCASWRFYPRMSGLGPWWAYVPFALLALLPAAAELAARLRERRLA